MVNTIEIKRLVVGLGGLGFDAIGFQEGPPFHE